MLDSLITNKNFKTILNLIQQVDLKDKKSLFFIILLGVLAVIAFFIIIAIFLEILRIIRLLINRIFIKIFGHSLFIKNNKEKEDEKRVKKNAEAKGAIAVNSPVLFKKIEIAGTSKKESEKKKEIEIPKKENLKIVYGSEGQEIVQKENDEIEIPKPKDFGNMGTPMGPTITAESLQKHEMHREIDKKTNKDGHIKIKTTAKDNNHNPSSTDRTIFAGRNAITMREAVYDLTTKSTAPHVVEGRAYTLKEREEIAKKISNFNKFGTELEKSERGKIYRLLKKEQIKASPSERMKIDRQIKFLKGTIGK